MVGELDGAVSVNGGGAAVRRGGGGPGGGAYTDPVIKEKVNYR